MNCVLAIAITSSLVTCAYGRQDDSVSGTYRLQVTDQARALARVMGEPAPEGALILGSDHIFEIVYRTVTESTHRFGHYWVDGGSISLRFRNRSQDLSGTIQNGSISVGGIEYRSNYWRPAPISSGPPAVFYPDPNPPKFIVVTPAPPPLPPPAQVVFDAVGSWQVTNHGAAETNSIMTFDRDGNFSFSGHGASSRGHYTVHDGVITLVWTQIDDDPVDEGTVKKDVRICSDGCSFDIDLYHYCKCAK